MLNRPEELDEELIAETVRRSWDITPLEVAHVALGHGSSNWMVVAGDGEKWFVKVDPADVADFFAVTHRTAAAARDRGLWFVNAAVPARSGELSVRIGDDWILSVVEFIDGHGPDFRGPERALVAGAIGQLHALTPLPEVAFDWTPGYRHPALRALLASGMGRRWDGGPYAEAAHELVADSAHGIEKLFALLDRRYEQLLADDAPWVLTHGEPHGGNSLIDAAGRAHLVDCNAMLIAPPERDLRLLLHGSHQGDRGRDNTEVLEAYRRGRGGVGDVGAREYVSAREYVLDLLRADWHLMEISAYAVEFSGPHEENRDTASHWHWLNRYLPVEQNWS